MNPASSGLDINQEVNYTLGTGRQWLGMDNAPKQNFFNLSYTIRPPRSYKSWQNAGLYVDLDDTGLMTNAGVYGSYTKHFLIRKRMVVSLGVMAGARRYQRSIGIFDQNDPAIQNNRGAITIYPDIIPGIRISDKKYFVGFSARQLTIYKLQDFKGRRIGSPSRLYPSLYFEYGRMITLSESFLVMPSAALNMPVLGVPIVDANVIVYYANRVGLGAGLRNTSFASGIFQIRFLKNMTAGFAYSYPINATRYAARNSFEIMLGVVPVGMSNLLTGRHSIAKCPTMSY